MFYFGINSNFSLDGLQWNYALIIFSDLFTFTFEESQRSVALRLEIVIRITNFIGMKYTNEDEWKNIRQVKKIMQVSE